MSDLPPIFLPLSESHRDDVEWHDEWVAEVLAVAQVSEPPTSRPPRRRIRRANSGHARIPELVLPSPFFDLPMVLQREILLAAAFSADPCRTIGRACQLNRDFAAICRDDDDFWKSLCTLKRLTDPWLLAPDSYHRARFDEANDAFSWRKWFQYWCRRELSNSTLRSAINTLLLLDSGDQSRPLTLNVNGRDVDLGPISTWNTRFVTDMSALFQATNETNDPDHQRFANAAMFFNQDISRWDTSNVTNMAAMFDFARAFNMPIGGWDVSNVVTMKRMFAFSGNFDQDLSQWDVSKVMDMSYMFYAAEAFDGDIGGWDVSNVRTMKGMFRYATKFSQDLSGWRTTRLTNRLDMFKGASGKATPPAFDPVRAQNILLR